MSTKYFNFNNEADLTPIEVNDETGVVQFTLDGQVATFDSVQEFAEFYALARNVVPENLKNWTLTEDGNHVAFVLRAGTAGLEADEIANIANGLRAAGMSPEEIGRVIASAQTTETPNVSQAETSIHDRKINELTTLFNNLSPLDRTVLSENLGLVDAEDVIANLVENVDEDWYDDDDLYDVLDLALDEAIQDAIDSFDDLPVTLAKSLYADFYGDQDEAFEDLRKAVLTAHAASRQLEVYVYDRDAEFGQYILYDRATIRRILTGRQEYDIVCENKKFYVISD